LLAVKAATLIVPIAPVVLFALVTMYAELDIPEKVVDGATVNSLPVATVSFAKLKEMLPVIFALLLVVTSVFIVRLPISFVEIVENGVVVLPLKIKLVPFA
jgi:hypothetical protein